MVLSFCGLAPFSITMNLISQIKWDSPASEWTTARSKYTSAVKAASAQRRKADLEHLEDQVFTKLPAGINSRKPRHIQLDELQTIVKWKLQRGKWRPRLEKLASSNSETDVVDESTKAFKLLKEDDPKGALGALIELKGVGPATASAIIAIVDRSVVFMSDEVLIKVFGERKYTMKVYLELLTKVKDKAGSLQKESGEEWTPRMVERAVYASTILSDDPTTKTETKTETKKKPTKSSKSKKAKSSKPVAKEPRSKARKRSINQMEKDGTVRRSSRLKKSKP